MKHNIFLVGPSGAGKTTVGREIARRLDLQYYDTDQEIETRSGVEISWIFELEQEAGFRQRETAVIQALCAMKGIVLATGGGAVTSPENIKCLKARGIVIYLKVSLAEQLARVAHKLAHRPLIARHPEETLKKLNAQREALYQQVADIEIDTDHLSVHDIANRAINLIKKREGRLWL